ncbi:MAG: phytoene desaturase [Anaerolineales bacterium]|nr:MAG: phytoene desaturase [Anaerolineales bacterium]
MTSALVIGAGLGGLATACRLAHNGYTVTVVEKGDRAGGRCGRFQRDGHHFDTGPTVMVLPHVWAETFGCVGERLEDHVDLRRADPTYKVGFGDGSTLTLTSDLTAMQARLESIEPGAFGALLRYLNEGHRHYTLAMPLLAERRVPTWLEMLDPAVLAMLARTKVLRRHYGNVRRYFSDPRLLSAFTFQDMYLSLSPFEAPATFSLLQYTEFAHGIWFPMGGTYTLVEALAGIAEDRGARFLYETSVKRVNVDGRRVTGVTLGDGRQLDSDIVIANADLSYVYRCLLPPDGMAKRLERKRYSCSTVMFHWGVDKLYSQFELHNIFLADAYKRTSDQILKDLTLADEATFYLHAPARVDPSLAPEGQETLSVAVPVGHIDDAAPQDWEAIRERARRQVLERLALAGAGDLEEHIKFEESVTPLDWLKRYNLTKGSTLGLGHNLSQLSLFRPRNRHARYRNLYFAGASTHPGSGMPAVLLSARFAAERVMKDVGAA